MRIDAERLEKIERVVDVIRDEQQQMKTDAERLEKVERVVGVIRDEQQRSASQNIWMINMLNNILSQLESMNSSENGSYGYG